jgi:hypothetical protein
VTSLTALAFTAFLVARQSALKELRAGNETLRRQFESQTNLVPSPSAADNSSTDSATPLSAEEKSELLRLRGQFPSLRSQLADASNHVVSLSQPHAPNTAQEGQVSLRVQQENLVMEDFMRSEAFLSARALSKAVQTYIQEHDGQLPENLAAVQLPGDRDVAEQTIRRFELVRSGTITDDPSMLPYLLVAREREPIQLPDGRRLYLFIQANGGLTINGYLPGAPGPGPDIVRATEEQGRRRMRQQQVDARQ